MFTLILYSPVTRYYNKCRYLEISNKFDIFVETYMLRYRIPRYIDFFL